MRSPIRFVCWQPLTRTLSRWVGAIAQAYRTTGRQWLRAMVIAGLAIGLWWGSAIAVLADDASEDATTQPSPSTTELNATDIPSEKVDQFVSAYLKVVELIDDRTEELQRAETEAESARLQRSIQSEAFDLIEAAGLSRQDYWQLLGLANTDPEFRDRVLAQLEEQDQ